MRRTYGFSQLATTVLTLLVVSGMVPAGAAAANNKVVLKLTPATIVANGSSTSVATATVTNNGKAVTGDQVAFSSNSGQSISQPTIDNKNGTYTATVTSTRAAGQSTITATDTNPTMTRVSDTARLTQVAGPAAHVVVGLAPSSIVANGASTSVATATVTDAFNNRVAGAKIAFSANDGGIRFGAVTDHGDGTYTSTLTSSTSPGSKLILATDSAPLLIGTASLTQTSPVSTVAASTVTMSVAPPTPVTNQIVTLVAIVTAPNSASAPAGTVAFASQGRSITGCENVPTVAQAGQRLSEAICQVAFAASTSPASLAATFHSRSPSVADSSTTTTLGVGRAATSTSLDVSNPTVIVGSTATFTAQVAPSQIGAAAPGGAVDFFDGGQPIAGCSNVPVVVTGSSRAATCAVTYSRSGQHSITARYDGDGNFASSTSTPAQSVSVHALPPHVLGTIKAVMQWTFYYTPKYTRILAFVVKRAPVGASVSVSCSDSKSKSCPYAKRVNSVRARTVCKSSRGHNCPKQSPGTIDLHGAFHRSRLAVGARVIVRITRANYIGKYYLFQVRAGHPPTVRISCLAPGGSRPGVGC